MVRFNDLLIPGSSKASMQEKIADFLLTGPRALLKPKFSSDLYGGYKMSVIPTPSHRLKMSSSLCYSAVDAFIGRAVAIALAPLVFPPLFCATLLGKSLKNRALKKEDALLYNNLCKEYVRIKELSKEMQQKGKKITPEQVNEFLKLSQDLHTHADAYWNVAKKAEKPIEPLPGFGFESDLTANPILFAIEKSDTALAKKLIQEKTFSLADRTPKDQYTALHLAVLTNNHAIIKELVKAQPNLLNMKDIRENTPLHYAVTSRTLKTVELLISLGADVNAVGYQKNTPLHFAVIAKNPKIAEILLKNNASPEARNKNSNTPLMSAFKYTNVEVSKLLLKKVDTVALLKVIDGKQNTYLHLATKTGSLELVKTTLELFKKFGVDISSPDSPLHYQNSDGNTPLHCAAIAAPLAALAEADSNKRKTLEKDVEEIMNLLIKEGSNKFTKNYSGKTPAQSLQKHLLSTSFATKLEKVLS